MADRLALALTQLTALRGRARRTARRRAGTPAALLPRGGEHDPRVVARLPDDLARGRPARRTSSRRLVCRSHRTAWRVGWSGSRLAHADDRRSRSCEGLDVALLRAEPGDPVGPTAVVRAGSAELVPDAGEEMRAMYGGDADGAAELERARLRLVHVRADARARSGARHGDVRDRRSGAARSTRPTSRSRRSSPGATGGCGRERAALPRGRGARAGGPRARRRRRRRLPRRRPGSDPPLEPGRRGDHGPAGRRRPQPAGGRGDPRLGDGLVPDRRRRRRRRAAGPAETVPLEIQGRELWLSISGVGFADGTVYASAT